MTAACEIPVNEASARAAMMMFVFSFMFVAFLCGLG
jgi:hypothetical protein